MADLNGEKSTGGNLNGVLSPVHPVYKIDETLTKGGYAADAKATGDALAGKAPSSHVTDKNNPHGVTPGQIGALPISGGTLTGELNVNRDTTNGIRMWADNEGGNIRIYPPGSNTYADYWDIDCHDGGMRIFAYKKSTNPNGGPGNVFPLTLGTDGSIKVGNTAKTRANLGVVPGAESTASPNCYYRTVDGVTEWINPPMELGVEYRTTERWNGNVVYTKLVNCGTAINNATVTLEGVTACVRFIGYLSYPSETAPRKQLPIWSGSTIGTSYHAEITQPASPYGVNQFIIKTDSNADSFGSGSYNWYVHAWYTKD